MKINHAVASLGAGAAVFLAACNADKLTNVNVNPNAPNNAPSSALFTNAAREGVGRWENGLGGTRYGFLSQHFAEVQYPDDDAYTRIRASGTTTLFDQSYNVELQDLELVKRRGRAANDTALWGPADVLQAWEFGILTDIWGDVPYSQTFKADSGILNPAFDPQQQIYASLFTRLAADAAALGATSKNTLGDADPIYAGDTKGWQKFANSLRLRHALRLVNVDPTTASAQLQAALADPTKLILTNADNAKLTWPGGGVYDHPWAANFKTRDDFRLSTRLVTYLRDLNDPRTVVYGQPATVVIPESTREDSVTNVAGNDTAIVTQVTVNYCPGGGSTCYVGLANALTQADASPLVPNTSRPGALWYPGATSYGTFGGAGAVQPSYLMTAAEVYFIRAEAAELGIGGLSPTQAKAFYDTAVTRSMEMFNIDAGKIATYLAQSSVSYAAATTHAERMKRIAIQKWLALYIDPIQAWTEVRRTCQPAIVKPGPNAVANVLPRRFYYSVTEKAVNGTNYNAAVARQGKDNFNTRIYWDKNPTAAPTYEAGCNVRAP